jgi:hypothetical protein
MVGSPQVERAKHLTRLTGVTFKKGSYRLSLDRLTKGVQSCKGRPDTSQSRLFPLALHHAGGVGYAPVLVYFGGGFGSDGFNLFPSPLGKQTTKPPTKQT